MAKIKNDQSQYIRRSHLVAGSPVKISSAHRKPDPDRAKQIADKIVTLRRVFVEF